MWLRVDRPAMTQVLEGVVFGVQEAIGVARFPVSAEYAAAVIAVFVKPCNFVAAAAWYADRPFNAALADGEDGIGAEIVTAHQMFALLLEISGDGVLPAQYLAQYKKRVGIPDDSNLEVPDG